MAVLLIPAIVLGGFSMWFLEASWIGVAMILVGVAVAAIGSMWPLNTSAVVAVLAVEIGLLFATAIVGFAIDCARHCS